MSNADPYSDQGADYREVLREAAQALHACVGKLQAQYIRDGLAIDMPSVEQSWAEDVLTKIQSVLAGKKSWEEKVNITPTAKAKLDAAVDAHDRAESVQEDVSYFNQQLYRALGIPDPKLREAAMEERESCAKLAESLKDGPGLDGEWYVATAKDAAAVIRARGTKP